MQPDILDFTSQEYQKNPYICFKQLRHSKPVCKTNIPNCWAIPGFREVQFVLKNSEIFSSEDIAAEPDMKDAAYLLLSRGLIGIDKPRHGRLRGLIAQAFTPRIIRQLEPKIRLICQILLKNMLTDDYVDYVELFSAPLPIMVMGELLGINIEHMNDFRSGIHLLLTWRRSYSLQEAKKEIDKLFKYFNHIIEEKRKAPGEDLISALILACDQDSKLTNDEIMGFVRLLLVAGTDSSTHLLGNALLALYANPTCFANLKKDKSYIPGFIEELLRFDGPVLALQRKAKIDIEIGNTLIRKGEMVLPLVASANHDETIFTNPEQFDFRRNTKAKLAFGSGIHHCIGVQLARLKLRIALEEIIHSIDSFEISTASPPIYIKSMFFRGVEKLHIKSQCSQG